MDPVVGSKRMKNESTAVLNDQSSGIKMPPPPSSMNQHPVDVKSESAPVLHQQPRKSRNIWPVRSEYTIQFANATAQHSSPLLRAEQVNYYYNCLRCK